MEAKTAFSKPSDLEQSQAKSDLEHDDSASIPTEDEMDEVMTPGLSIDSFELGGKSFAIQISNIKTQKQMVKSMDSIAELMGSLDVAEVAKGYRERTLAGLESGDTDGASSMIELIQDVIQRGGISNILITLMDLFVGVVYATCRFQDNDITRDWVEENLGGFAQAQEIFFAQLEKDSIQGRVIDFLHFATRAVVGE